MKKIVTDFSYGEISTKFDGRADLPYYTKGCSELRNMYVMPQGVAGRIGGSDLFIDSLFDTSTPVGSGILIPYYFEGSIQGVVRLLQISTTNIIDVDVFTMSGAQTLGTGVTWAAGLEDVQWTQVDKKLILTHPNGRPLQITWSLYTPSMSDFTTSGTTFNTAGNYPSVCSYFAGRLIFAGTSNHPDYLWASKTFDIDDFTIGNNDDDAFATQITTADYNKILWCKPKDEGLVVGTATTETMITGGDNGLTPTSLQQTKISSYGSSHTDPVQIGLSTVFVEGGERVLRELAYTDQNGALYSPDLTMLADHLTESGIKRITYQLEPFEAIFALRKDGKVALLTYDRNTGTNAWSLLDLGCEVMDICTVGNSIFFLTKRGTDICIEKLRPYEDNDQYMWWSSGHYFFEGIISDLGRAMTFSESGGKVLAETLPSASPRIAHNLLSGWKIMLTEYKDKPVDEYIVEWVNAYSFYLKGLDGNYITELPHGMAEGVVYPVKKSFYILDSNSDPVGAGQELDVIINDHIYLGKFTPDNYGEIKLPVEAWKVTVGHRFTSHMKTMRLMQDAIGNPVARINKVYLRLWKSLGCKIGQTMEDSEEITFRDGELDLGVPALYTGDKEHTMLTEYTTQGHFYVWTDDIHPLYISAMAVDYRAGGQRR